MKPKSNDGLAESFGLEPIQLNHYLQGVKREFKIPPPTKLLKKHLASLHVKELPMPRELAKLIGEQYDYPLKITGRLTSEPPLRISNATLARARKKYEKNVILRNLPPKSNPKEKNVEPYDKLAHERISEQALAHCPHGVPKTRVCAICDPEKFKEING